MKQLDCPHCYKANVFSSMDTKCPYCDTFHLPSDVEKLMNRGCYHCGNRIKYIACIYCQGKITVDASLPEERILICHPKVKTNFLELFRDLAIEYTTLDNNDPEVISFKKNVGETFDNLALLFFGDKAKKFSDDKALVGLNKYQQMLMKTDELMRLADFNLKKAQGTEAHHKAEILKNSIQYIEKMPDYLKYYVIDSLFGQNKDKQTKVLDDEIERQIKEQELRKQTIDNDDRERKANENI